MTSLRKPETGSDPNGTYDWTGRQIRRDDKKGRIPAELAPIME